MEINMHEEVIKVQDRATDLIDQLKNEVDRAYNAGHLPTGTLTIFKTRLGALEGCFEQLVTMSKQT